MEHVFDDLIRLQKRPQPDRRALPVGFAMRLAGDLVVGFAVAIGTAVGRAIAS